jgi:caa(3)-type oxidase subunit IV
MGEHGHHSVKPYIRIYFILLGLFVISVMGPVIADVFFASEDGISYTLTGTILVLTTAFGIAFVKAYLVAAKFMHLDVEKPIVWYILTTCLVFMVLFFAAVAPDVKNHAGDNWENVAAKKAIAAGIIKGRSQLHHHGDHGEGHGDDHGAKEGHGDDHGAKEGHGDDHGAKEGHGDEHGAKDEHGDKEEAGHH